MIDIIKTEDQLFQLREQWTELYNSSSTATPFQSFDYVWQSWKCFSNDNQLYIICVKGDSTNKLEAVIPCAISSNGILRFINDAHIDFCGAIVADGCVWYNLYEGVAKHILENKDIKKAVFMNLMAGDPMLSAFKPFCTTCFVTDCNYYSEIDISSREKDKDFIDAFRNINAKQKKNFRTLLKKNDGKVDFRIHAMAAGDEYPEEAVEYLSNKMMEEGIRVKSYFSDSMLSFWKKLYQAGLLSAAVLRIDGELKSLNFMYYDVKRNEYIKWIMLYVENRFNMLINLYIANYLYEHEGATINFARGIYDYKMVNFHPDVKPLYRLIITKSIWSSVSALWDVNYYYIRQIGKKLLRK